MCFNSEYEKFEISATDATSLGVSILSFGDMDPNYPNVLVGIWLISPYSWKLFQDKDNRHKFFLWTYKDLLEPLEELP
jgi:hypothetical protein